MKTLKQKRRKIENHLKSYQQYKIGIKNLKLQLDTIMPNITVSYEVREGSVGAFMIQSETEKYAIDRIESKRALDLHEQMKLYELLVNCIDAAIEKLDDDEKKFVECRYFSNFTMRKISIQLGYGESTLFNIRTRVLDKLTYSLGNLPDV